MAITVTETAAQKVKIILAEKGNPDAALRVFVQGGGCSGLSYGMTLDHAQEGDQVFEEHGIKVIVDPRSYMFVNGSNVDFVDNMMGGGFKIDNPNAQQSCGCGHSFQPKNADGAPGAKSGGCCH